MLCIWDHTKGGYTVRFDNVMTINQTVPQVFLQT